MSIWYSISQFTHVWKMLKSKAKQVAVSLTTIAGSTSETRPVPRNCLSVRETKVCTILVYLQNVDRHDAILDVGKLVQPLLVQLSAQLYLCTPSPPSHLINGVTLHHSFCTPDFVWHRTNTFCNSTNYRISTSSQHPHPTILFIIKSKYHYRHSLNERLSSQITIPLQQLLYPYVPLSTPQ